jgi:hypothetical protein
VSRFVVLQGSGEWCTLTAGRLLACTDSVIGIAVENVVHLIRRGPGVSVYRAGRKAPEVRQVVRRTELMQAIAADQARRKLARTESQGRLS